MSVSGKKYPVNPNSDETRQKKGRLTINHPTKTRAVPVHASERESSTSPNMFHCHKCPFYAKHNIDIRRHMELHEDANFTCNLCNWPSRSKSHMTGHERQVHGVGNVDEKFVKHCQLCSYTTLHSGDFARHRKKHLNTKFSCKVCNYPFMNEKIMEVHIKRMHKGMGEMNARVQYPERIQQKLHGNMVPTKMTKTETITREHDFKSKANIKKTYHVKDNTQDSDAHNKYEKHASKRHREQSAQETGDRNAIKWEKSKLSITAKNEKRKKENGNAYTPENSCSNVETPVKERKHSKHANRRNHSKPKWRLKFKDSARSEESIKGRHKHYSSKTTHELLTSMCTSDTSSSLDDTEMTNSDNGTLANESKEFEIMTIFLDDNTSVTTMKCLKCVYLTTNQKLFQEHMHKHKHCSYECNHCHMPFVQQNDLRKHEKSAHNITDSEDIESITSIECTESESVTSVEGEEENMDIEFSVACASPLEAEKGKPFSVSKGDIHDTETDKEISCAFCEFKTMSYFELKEHIVSHVEDENDVCSNSPAEDENNVKDENDVCSNSPVEDENDGCSNSPVEDENDVCSNSSAEDENDMCSNSPVEDENDVEDGNNVCNNGFEVDGYEVDVGVLKNNNNDPPGSSKVSNLTNVMDIDAPNEEEALGKVDQSKAEDEHENEPVITESKEYLPIDTETFKTKEENLPVNGNLSKEEFKRTRKLYRKTSTSEDGRTYECLVCTENNRFKSARKIWIHFKKHHKKLRRRICSSCPYCSKPFPQLK